MFEVDDSVDEESEVSALDASEVARFATSVESTLAVDVLSSSSTAGVVSAATGTLASEAEVETSAGTVVALGSTSVFFSVPSGTASNM